MAFWSVLLYLVYAVFFVWCLRAFGGDIAAALTGGEARDGWFVGGVRYAAYNLGIIPAILFTVRHAERRRHSVVAGLLAGPIAMVPALLFYLSMIGQYPAILDRAVPANALLEVLGSRGFQLTFQLDLFARGAVRCRRVPARSSRSRCSRSEPCSRSSD